MNLCLPLNSFPSGSPILGDDLERLGSCFFDNLISTIVARDSFLSNIKTVDISKFNNFIQTSRNLYISLEEIKIAPPKLQNWCQKPKQSESQPAPKDTPLSTSLLLSQLQAAHPPPLFRRPPPDLDYRPPSLTPHRQQLIVRRQSEAAGSLTSKTVVSVRGRHVSLLRPAADQGKAGKSGVLDMAENHHRKRYSMLDSRKGILVRNGSVELNNKDIADDQRRRPIELKRSKTVTFNRLEQDPEYSVENKGYNRELLNESVEIANQPVVRLNLFERRSQPFKLLTNHQESFKRQRVINKQVSMDGEDLKRYLVPTTSSKEFQTQYRIEKRVKKPTKLSEDSENFNDRLISVNGRQLLPGTVSKKSQVKRVESRGVTYRPPKDLRLLTEIRKLISQKPKPYKIY